LEREFPNGEIIDMGVELELFKKRSWFSYNSDKLGWAVSLLNNYY
jgi:hypothetical protein